MIERHSILPRAVILCNPLLAGTYYIVAETSVFWIGPFSFLALESIFLAPTALAATLICAKRGTSIFSFSQFLMGVLLFSNMLVSIISLSYTTVTNAGFYTAAIGPMTALASRLVYSRTMPIHQVAATIVAALGAGLLVFNGLNANGNWRGDLLSLIATSIFVAYILCLESKPIDNETVTSWTSQMFGVSTMSFITHICCGRVSSYELINERAVLVGLYGSVFTTMLPVLFSTYAQKHLSAVFVSFTYLLEPIWAAALAYIVLGEHMDYVQVLGGCLVVAASIIMWALDKNE